MDTQYRLLSPHESSDVALLHKVLGKFLDDERTYGSPVYPYVAMAAMAKYVMEQFMESVMKNDHDFMVCGAFDGEEIVGVSVGQKLHHMWGMQSVILPQWALVLMYMKHREMRSPKDRLHSLLSPIISAMEADGFYSWYKVSKFRLGEHPQTYLDKIYSRTINAERYFVTIEALVENQEQRDGLPSTFRRLFPVLVHDGVKLGLLQHHFKNNLRKFNDERYAAKADTGDSTPTGEAEQV